MAAFGTPPIYRSTGVIMIEEPNISTSVVRAAPRQVDEQQLRLVSRRVMRSENVRDLVDQYDLYPQAPASERPERLRSDMGLDQVDPITFEPRYGASAFSVSFDYPDPVKAMQVASSLVQLFIADNRAERTQSATETEDFFRSEADKLRQELAEAGDRLAEFKLEKQGLLPEEIERNQQLLERLREDRFGIQASLRLATERRNLLAVQRDELAGGTELAQLRSELAVARQKYSDDHPDIRRLTRAIEALENSAGGTSDAEFMRVSAQLQAIEDEINAYEIRDRNLQIRIADLETRLVSAPEVEKELVRLTRELELANAQYEAIRIRQSEARLGSNLVTQDQSERYTIIREPGVPSSPVYPNRLGILLIGILLAFGGSAVLVALREGGDPSVRSTRDVVEIYGSPPLANIPQIRNAVDRGRHTRKILAHAAGFSIVWVVAMWVVVYG